MQDFHYTAPACDVVFGAGAARTQLLDAVDRVGGRRVLLVATPRETQLARELAAPLGARVVAAFDAVRQHVPAAIAEQARALASTSRADVVLSIGGGSTTGTAKAIALTSGLPIVAVPTTYAGSEVTPVWGITEDGRKTTGRADQVLPRVVVYDPQLTLTLPAGLSAASGLNALAHSVEALWAPGANPITALMAQESIGALGDGLPGVVADPGDLPARAQALYGAWLAGTTLAVAGSGLHHKICHVLGGAYDLPHAQTHAVVLPHVLAFNAPAAPEAVARLARALDAPDALAALDSLYSAIEAPRSLRALGLPEDRLPEAAALIVEAAPPSNPRPVTLADALAILKAAF
jgi:maleylacetate reductase